MLSDVLVRAIKAQNEAGNCLESFFRRFGRGKRIIMGVSSSSSQLNSAATADRISLKLSNRMVPACRRSEEHRRDPRIPVDDMGSMRVVSPESVQRSAVRILDVSKRGMKLWVPVFVHPGIKVQIRMKELNILGEVCYCVAEGAGFCAGISIETVFERLLGHADGDE